ncbi:hypothetical protein ABK040_012299 [Willaertia magna]
MSLIFTDVPQEQQDRVEELLNEGLYEFLLFSLGCNYYEINNFNSIENLVLQKQLKEIKFETILQKAKKKEEEKLKSSSKYISYKNNTLNNNENYIDHCNEDTLQLEEITAVTTTNEDLNSFIVSNKIEKKHILEDCWKNIVNFIGIKDFNSFLKVCKHFYFILKESNNYRNTKNKFNKVYNLSGHNTRYYTFYNKYFPIYDMKEVLLLGIFEDSDNLIKQYREFKKLIYGGGLVDFFNIYYKNRKLTNFEQNLLEFIIIRNYIDDFKIIPIQWFENDNNSLYLSILENKNNQFKFNFIPNSLQNDKDFALYIATYHSYLFPYLNCEFQKDINLITICLDNLIRLQKSYIHIIEDLTVDFRKECCKVPELFIKLLTVYKRGITPDIAPISNLLVNFNGSVLIYELIKIDPFSVGNYFISILRDNKLGNLIVDLKEIFKLFIKNNFLNIIYYFPKELKDDVNFASELVSLNLNILPYYSSYFKNEEFITTILKSLPDIENYETQHYDHFKPKEFTNLNCNLNLLIKKLGVSKLLLYNRNLKYYTITFIMSKYSTRIVDCNELNGVLDNEERLKLKLQKVYIDGQRKKLIELNGCYNKENIFVEPLNDNELNSLLRENKGIELAKTILQKEPLLFIYCGNHIKTNTEIQECVFYNVGTIDKKIQIVDSMSCYLTDFTIIIKFLKDCLFIAPSIFNPNTKKDMADIFINNFIPEFVNYLINNGCDNELTLLVNKLQTNAIPSKWREDKEFIEKVLNIAFNSKDIKYTILSILKVKNKEIALQLVKENTEYWTLLDDNVKVDDLNIVKCTLEGLVMNDSDNHDEKTTIIAKDMCNLFLVKYKKRIRENIDILQMFIKIDSTLINLLPSEFQLNYNILQIVFENDLMNCVNYLSIDILDSYKFIIFDMAPTVKRKAILQQFKQRYDKEYHQICNLSPLIFVKHSTDFLPPTKISPLFFIHSCRNKASVEKKMGGFPPPKQLPNGPNKREK